jgi:hypothetical protein
MSGENLIMSSVNGVSSIRPEIALNGLTNGLKNGHHEHHEHKNGVATERYEREGVSPKGAYRERNDYGSLPRMMSWPGIRRPVDPPRAPANDDRVWLQRVYFHWPIGYGGATTPPNQYQRLDAFASGMVEQMLDSGSNRQHFMSEWQAGRILVDPDGEGPGEVYITDVVDASAILSQLDASVEITFMGIPMRSVLR